MRNSLGLHVSSCWGQRKKWVDCGMWLHLLYSRVHSRRIKLNTIALHQPPMQARAIVTVHWRIPARQKHFRAVWRAKFSSSLSVDHAGCGSWEMESTTSGGTRFGRLLYVKGYFIIWHWCIRVHDGCSGRKRPLQHECTEWTLLHYYKIVLKNARTAPLVQANGLSRLSFWF